MLEFDSLWMSKEKKIYSLVYGLYVNLFPNIPIQEKAIILSDYQWAQPSLGSQQAQFLQQWNAYGLQHQIRSSHGNQLAYQLLQLCSLLFRWNVHLIIYCMNNFRIHHSSEIISFIFLFNHIRNLPICDMVSRGLVS